MEEKDKGGKPPITEEEKNEMVQKLEPYLKSGLSIRKAVLEAQIPRSTFYDLMAKDPKFADQINRFRQFISVLLNNGIVRQLQTIIQKQNEKQKLDSDELNFMKWFADHSNLTKEEFGERKDIGIYDPEVEIQRLLGLINEATEGEKNASTE